LIDGYGFQHHLQLRNNPSPEIIAAKMERMADIGVGVYITEMTVDLYDGAPGVTPEQLDSKADIYARVLKGLIASGKGKSFTLGGLGDSHTAITPNSGWGHVGEAPVILDEKYEEKPAAQAIKRVLQE
jgi:GH35 family endo-1,4-beta-xylanase